MQPSRPRRHRAAMLGAGVLATLGVLAGPAAQAMASPGDGDAEAPAATDPPPTTLGVVTTTLPPGCPEPPAATAVFLGQVVESDFRTARFRVEQLRAGSLDGWQVGGLVDVDFEDDVRYLDEDETYLVGVGTDPQTRRLVSKVGEAAPLFGGNQVVGVNDNASCPEHDDPVRTIHPDGSSVESGLLHPLTANKGGIARSLVLPVVWVFLALVVLAAAKGLLVGGGRELLRVARGERRIRDEDIWHDAGYDD